MKTELYSRILYIAKKYFKTMQDLCNKLGITHQGLLLYRTRNYLSAPLKLKFAEIGINPNFLETGEGEETIKPIESYNPFVIEKHKHIVKNNSIYVNIPMVESAFPRGVPESNIGSILFTLVEREVISDIKNPYFFLCKGNSMSPTIIDGWAVIVEVIKGNISQLKNYDIVVAYLNGEYIIRRFIKVDNTSMLVPDNIGSYLPIILKPTDEIKIIGIVKKILATVKRENL